MTTPIALVDVDGAQAALPGVLVDQRIARRRANNRATYQRRASAHIDKVKEWRAAHPGKAAEYHERYWKKHRKRIKRERAAKRAAAYAADPKGMWHRPNSPSLDRIVPERGYVAGNLRVISNRANTLKNNATIDEMRLVLADLERIR